jgi:transposase
LRKDDKFSQGIRLHAVYQIAKGKDAKELQEVYSTTHKSICNWVHRYNAEGLEGLKDRLRTGRPSFLSQSQKLELDQMLQNAPSQYGYNTSTWTGALVTDLVNKRFGVVYKIAQIYNILHSLGFSFQRGKGYFPEAEKKKKKVEELKKTSNHR